MERIERSIAGVDYANIANGSFLLDFNTRGMTDTIMHLDEMNIMHTGAGVNIKNAQRSVIIKKNNLKIGFISFLMLFIKIGQLVDQTIRNQSYRNFMNSIRKLKKKCDFIIVYLHWGPLNSLQELEAWASGPGPNYQDTVPDSHRTFAADVIAGTSAHHVMEIERINNGIVCYSLGDFVDDYAIDSHYRNDLGFFLKINISKKKSIIKSIEIIPTRITDCQVNRAIKKEDIDHVMKSIILSE